MDRYLKKKRKCGETAGATAVKKQSRPHYLPCPICSLQFSSSLIEAHAAQCMPRDALQPVPVPAQLKRPATNIKEAPSKKCAFSHLMKVAKVKPKPIRFEGKVDGNRFSVSWKHVDGGVDCAWKAKHLLPSKGKNAFDKGFCVKLCSHEPPASANAYAEIFSFAAVGLSVPVLKSCLQKAIRRQEVEVALRAAAELMKVSFREFIRRLTVIVLEDVMLRDSYPGLVWLLMADHKGFVPRREHVHFCLNAVRDLCECSLRDYAEMPPDVSPLELSALSEVTDDASKALVGSLIVRSRYGGMSCDLSLLQAAAKAWHGRLNEDCEAWLKRTKSDWSPSVMCRGFSSSPPVKPLLAAIDFHVCSWMPSKIYQDLESNEVTKSKLASLGIISKENATDLIKTCIWSFRSSLNRRDTLLGRPVEAEPEAHHHILWQLIRKQVDTISANMLRKQSLRS